MMIRKASVSQTFRQYLLRDFFPFARDYPSSTNDVLEQRSLIIKWGRPRQNPRRARVIVILTTVDASLFGTSLPPSTLSSVPTRRGSRTRTLFTSHENPDPSPTIPVSQDPYHRLEPLPCLWPGSLTLNTFSPDSYRVPPPSGTEYGGGSYIGLGLWSPYSFFFRSPPCIRKW